MEAMTIKAEPRKTSGTRTSRAMRAAGRLPAVIYGHGEPPETVSLAYHEVVVALAHGARTLQVDLNGAGKSNGNPTRIITEYPAAGGAEMDMSGGIGTETESATAVSAVDGSTAAPAVNPGEGGGGTAMMAGGGPCDFGLTAYTSVRLGYARNGRTVTFVHCESWCWNGGSSCPNITNYTINWAREFRYDGARARYLNRKLDGPSFKLGLQVELGATWTDYNGDEAYGDYTVTPGSPSTATSTDLYEPGLWRRVNSQARYQHGDHQGTLKLTSTSGGVGSGIRTFTAFGERIAGPTDRFGYVGAWGYQSTPIPESLNPDSAFPFLHVGHRYYDPSSGRFLQRDPIGVFGGSNVYTYLDGIPTDDTDPEGLQRGGGIPTVPGRPIPIPGQLPPFAGIPQTPLPPPSPVTDLASACNRLNNIWFGQPLLPPPRPPPPSNTPASISNPPNLEPWTPKPPPPAPQPRPRPSIINVCFVAGTVVHSSKGEVPIERITTGTAVASVNEVQQTTELASVTLVVRREARETIVIHVGGDRIECTAEHPFWVVGTGWTRAGELGSGQSLLSMSGDELPIRSVKMIRHAKPIVVYELAVDETHNYFVGSAQVLVHNKVN